MNQGFIFIVLFYLLHHSNRLSKNISVLGKTCQQSPYTLWRGCLAQSSCSGWNTNCPEPRVYASTPLGWRKPVSPGRSLCSSLMLNSMASEVACACCAYTQVRERTDYASAGERTYQDGMPERLSVLRLPAVHKAFLREPDPEVSDIAAEDGVHECAISGTWGASVRTEKTKAQTRTKFSPKNSCRKLHVSEYWPLLCLHSVRRTPEKYAMSSSERDFPLDAWTSSLSTRSGLGKLWSGQKAIS